MKTEQHPSKSTRGLTIAVVSVSILALLTFATSAYQESERTSATKKLNECRLDAERMLGERLHLEKMLVDLDGDYEAQKQSTADAEKRIAELHERLDASLRHARGLEGAAKRTARLTKELEALRAERDTWESQLAVATTHARDLEGHLQRTEQERAALKAQLEDHMAGARMVNNAEVDALRGKHGRLTVVARRAREIRMAFDLPENLAKGAAFKIITPSGKNFDGADPSVSWTVEETEAEPLASTDPVVLHAEKERAKRVHLKFVPEKKLEPGAYRIDVLSDGAYLNTVLLNLR